MTLWISNTDLGTSKSSKSREPALYFLNTSIGYGHYTESFEHNARVNPKDIEGWPQIKPKPKICSLHIRNAASVINGCSLNQADKNNLWQ